MDGRMTTNPDQPHRPQQNSRLTFDLAGGLRAFIACRLDFRGPISVTSLSVYSGLVLPNLFHHVLWRI